MIIGVIMIQLGVSYLAQAKITRTQTISLHRGWNAVFLEVYPGDPEPETVFAGTPVDIAASYYARNSSAQFITDPSADLFRQMGWGVWYAPDRPDAFLKTLHAIYGQQPYLLHSKSDYTWQVTGSVVISQVKWVPDSFNLIGFSVASPGAPTFAQFFEGATALDANRIYRLQDGRWRRLTDPNAESMRSGEAFWIYCAGASGYQGPLSVKSPSQQGLLLDGGIDNLVLHNETSHPVTPTIEHVGATPDSVPLSIVVQTVGDPTAPVRQMAAPEPAGTWTQSLPPLEAGSSMRIPFEEQRQAMHSFVQSSLLRISTDMGTETWIPVIGVRSDLKPPQ